VTDLRGASSLEATELQVRPAAASVIAACLSAQATAPRRSALGRAFGTSVLSDASRKPYVEALGELHVADELSRLGADWVILHDVPVGERGQVIDHLAIGPAGVFAIDIIHQPASWVTVRGDVLAINGAPRPHLIASRDLATDASVDLTLAAGINVPVSGLIVFVAPQSVSVRDAPDDVGVTSDRALQKWLAGRERILDSATVRRIADAAAEPRTWRGALPHRTPGFDAAAFDALRIDVQRAWLARGFWAAVLITAAAIAATQLLGA
jgi:hypothetical protein